MKLVVITGSVFGNAEDVAQHAVDLLQKAGIEVFAQKEATLRDIQAQAPEAFLIVTSTTGMGELPNNLQPLYYSIRDQFPAWSGKPYGVIALGDSNYGDTFCGAGEQMQELFEELGLVSVQEMLRLDASETVTPETDAEPWLQAFIENLKA